MPGSQTSRFTPSCSSCPGSRSNSNSRAAQVAASASRSPARGPQTARIARPPSDWRAAASASPSSGSQTGRIARGHSPGSSPRLKPARSQPQIKPEAGSAHRRLGSSVSTPQLAAPQLAVSAPKAPQASQRLGVDSPKCGGGGSLSAGASAAATAAAAGVTASPLMSRRAAAAQPRGSRHNASKPMSAMVASPSLGTGRNSGHAPPVGRPAPSTRVPNSARSFGSPMTQLRAEFGGTSASSRRISKPGASTPQSAQAFRLEGLDSSEESFLRGAATPLRQSAKASPATSPSQRSPATSPSQRSPATSPSQRSQRSQAAAASPSSSLGIGSPMDLSILADELWQPTSSPDFFDVQSDIDGQTEAMSELADAALQKSADLIQQLSILSLEEDLEFFKDSFKGSSKMDTLKEAKGTPTPSAVPSGSLSAMWTPTMTNASSGPVLAVQAESKDGELREIWRCLRLIEERLERGDGHEGAIPQECKPPDIKQAVRQVPRTTVLRPRAGVMHASSTSLHSQLEDGTQVGTPMHANVSAASSASVGAGTPRPATSWNHSVTSRNSVAWSAASTLTPQSSRRSLAPFVYEGFASSGASSASSLAISPRMCSVRHGDVQSRDVTRQMSFVNAQPPPTVAAPGAALVRMASQPKVVWQPVVVTKVHKYLAWAPGINPDEKSTKS